MRVTFGGKTYEVALSSDERTDHSVKVVGGRKLKPGTNNWLRAVRYAIHRRSAA